MATFSAFPAYFLGTACIGRGGMAILQPRSEYAHVGLPLEPQYQVLAKPEDDDDDPSGGYDASPLMLFKGIREISYGLTLVVLQRQGNEAAVTTFAAILALVRFGDGLVVWMNGGENLKVRAWGHWFTGANFLGWVIWRLTR